MGGARNRHNFPFDNVGSIVGSGIESLHEQSGMAVREEVFSIVAIGYVYKIVVIIEFNNVPHMGAIVHFTVNAYDIYIVSKG